MRKKLISTVLATLLFTSPGLALAQKGQDVLVKAGSETLNQGQFNLMLENMPPQLRMMLDSQPQLRTGMLQKWAEFSILAQEATASGLAKDEGVKQKINELRNRILVEEFITRNTGKTKVSDKMVKSYYKEHKAEFSHGEEISAQHILIRLEEGADEKAKKAAMAKIKTIQAKLKKGKDFGELAKEYSDDPGSKPNGGALGSFGHGTMVPEFEKVAFATKVGEISAPVQTKFGYHLIKVNEVKKAGTTALAEVQEQIKATISQQKQQEEVEGIISRLKKKYPIEIMAKEK
ncbi:MAG: peptidylprolyl isomerase [Thermodesulfobacteriota bacterium]